MISVIQRTTLAEDETSLSYWEGPADPYSARASRHSARDILLAKGLDEHVDTVTLVVSELVTNAVEAVARARQNRDPYCWFNPDARSPMLTSSVIVEANTIRMEVFDPIAEMYPLTCEVGQLDESGRGMFLVSAMCSRWGCDPADGGKCVWAELSLAAS